MKSYLTVLLLIFSVVFLSAQTDRVSLKKYCPKHEEQEGAICFAYATAYTALSIEHNIKNGITNENSKDFRSFSYGFVASEVKKEKSFWGKRFNRCGRNATAKMALEVLKNLGTVPFVNFQEKCACRKTNKFEDEAQKFRIQDYDTVGTVNLPDVIHIQNIKDKLLSKNPVITTIYQEGFFRNSNSSKTIVFPVEYVKKDINANHVVCLVGYDDNVESGSFLVKNNYNSWGEEGFSYVKYEDFIKLIRTSYVIEL